MLRCPKMQVLCITSFLHQIKKPTTQQDKVGPTTQQTLLKGRLSRHCCRLTIFLRHALCLNPVAKTRKSSKVYIDVMALLLHTFSNPRFLWFFACIILSLFRSDTYRFTQFRFYFQLYMYTLLRYKAKNLVFTCSADREWFLPFSALCCGPKCIQCLRKGVEKTRSLQVHLRLSPLMMLVR